MIKFWWEFHLQSHCTAFVQIKRAFKSYFCHQKNNKKAEFLQPPYYFVEVPISPISKSTPHFVLPLFFEEYLNPQVKINKMGNEHTLDYHPSSSRLTSRIHPLIHLWNPKGLWIPTLSEIILCKWCFPTNKLLCHSLRHPKLFWSRHSQNLVGDPRIVSNLWC